MRAANGGIISHFQSARLVAGVAEIVKPTMRVVTTLSICILVAVGNGCIIPLGRKATLGHEYSPEALLFLGAKGTSRDDVLSNLGPPLWESAESRVMLYVWETSLEWYIVPPKPLGPPGKDSSKTKRWGLLIAYSES